ncbi:hypothetical protein JOF56_000143 [Kibdelosporangium banguiense]|uniref:Sec translocon accessory complex subunit YajC n=1 Tax=Kibdelosporangium banguiense TaxID=1365924 RepID=A0ABS4T5L1_9PSEU|nr:hypothetical protein [Kibdelosporangium banguiense]MBP2319758.1 hypothetical protein [Kibdelosporangium banguiense]
MYTVSQQSIERFLTALAPNPGLLIIILIVLAVSWIVVTRLVLNKRQPGEKAQISILGMKIDLGGRAKPQKRKQVQQQRHKPAPSSVQKDGRTGKDDRP